MRRALRSVGVSGRYRSVYQTIYDHTQQRRLHAKRCLSDQVFIAVCWALLAVTSNLRARLSFYSPSYKHFS